MVSPAEAQVLLSMASGVDNRKPDADAAKAWAAILDGLSFEDCRIAVIEHFQTSDEYLMPIHVRRIVHRLRRDRVNDYGTMPDPPPELDPDDEAGYRRWYAATKRAIADGIYQAAPAALPSRTDSEIIRELRQRLRADDDNQGDNHE